MKRILFVCLIAMLLPACAPEPEPVPEAAPEPVFDQAAEEAAVRKRQETSAAAWNAHDAKAIAAMRVENFENWEGTTKGRAAYEKGVEESFAGPLKNFHSKMLEEIGIVFVTPDVAIYKSRYENGGMLDEAGTALHPTKALVADVYVKKNGKWMYAASFSRPMEE